MLLEVQRALVTHGRMQDHAHEQLETGQLILSGTLPVMQLLAERVGALADLYVPTDKRPEFLNAIRRSVATAIRDLADTTGQTVQERDILSSVEDTREASAPAEQAAPTDATELP